MILRTTVKGVACVAVLVALSVVGIPAAEGDEAAGGQKLSVDRTAPVEIAGAPFQVRVVHPDDEPAAGTALRAWNIQEKAYSWQGEADEDGVVRVPELDEAGYLLIVGDRVSLPLMVGEEGPEIEETVELLLPRGRTEFAGMSEDEQVAVLSELRQEDVFRDRYSAGQADDDDSTLTGWEPEGLGGLMYSPWFWVGSAAAVGGGIIIHDAVTEDDDDVDVVSPAN